MPSPFFRVFLLTFNRTHSNKNDCYYGLNFLLQLQKVSSTTMDADLRFIHPTIFKDWQGCRSSRERGSTFSVRSTKYWIALIVVVVAAVFVVVVYAQRQELK